MPVYNIPEALLGFLVFGSIGLLALFIVIILVIFVRESWRGTIW